jgi:ABC-2 type transport system ATP-binding protein
VSTLIQDTQRLQLRANGVRITEELRRDLEEVIQKHGGRVEALGHPTTTLEDLFVRIVEESKKHPGRRYLPAAERPGKVSGDGEAKV